MRRSTMARQFKKVLCPIDFSDHSFTALDYAADFARQYGGQLIPLHLVRNPLTALYGPPGAKLSSEVEHPVEKSKQLLADAARAHASGVPYEIVVTHGDPYTEVLDLATAQGADVIVMSTHGRTGPQRLIIGSVTEKVVRTAPCPVFTIRHAT